jgi:hypothetical protein
MTFSELKAAIDQTDAGLRVTTPVAERFLKSIHAVSKSMGHMAEAAKGARSKILSDMARFGASAVFLMVMPDDSNCLRLQVYTQHKLAEVPDPMSASNKEIKADFDLSIQLRQIYPGLCAFDFHQIHEMMIEHILGWNRQEVVSHEGGGVFGVLEAWSATIEEQRKKRYIHIGSCTSKRGQNCSKVYIQKWIVSLRLHHRNFGPTSTLLCQQNFLVSHHKEKLQEKLTNTNAQQQDHLCLNYVLMLLQENKPCKVDRVLLYLL